MGNNITHVSNIQIGENSVVISLKRYNELLEKEKQLQNKVIMVSLGWGGHTVYTDDEATKELAKNYQQKITENLKLEKNYSELQALFHEVKVEKPFTYTWKDIFKAIKSKF